MKDAKCPRRKDLMWLHFKTLKGREHLEAQTLLCVHVFFFPEKKLFDCMRNTSHCIASKFSKLNGLALYVHKELYLPN